MKCKIFSSTSMDRLEFDINNFIRDKEEVSISFSTSERGYHFYYSAILLLCIGEEKMPLEIAFDENGYSLAKFYKDNDLIEVTTFGSWNSFVKDNPEFSKLQFITAYKLYLVEGNAKRKHREVLGEEIPYSIINIVSKKRFSDDEVKYLTQEIGMKGMFIRTFKNG